MFRCLNNRTSTSQNGDETCRSTIQIGPRKTGPYKQNSYDREDRSRIGENGREELHPKLQSREVLKWTLNLQANVLANF